MSIFSVLLLAFGALAVEPTLPDSQPVTVRRGRTVTLAWDASPTPGCTYTVYWGSTEAFSNVVEVGTNLTATLTGLPMRCDLMFCVSASANGLESDPSNEVSVRRYAPKTNLVVEPPHKTHIQQDQEQDGGQQLPAMAAQVTAGCMSLSGMHEPELTTPRAGAQAGFWKN